jgi:hypothetical protein
MGKSIHGLSTLVLSLFTVNSNKKKKENQGMTLVKTMVL